MYKLSNSIKSYKFKVGDLLRKSSIFTGYKTKLNLHITSRLAFTFRM